ncbi:DgyrCDS10619 [Dimorphilus gyrociliatus]|uniref:Ras-related protein Rab-43 n=1 Tax=Dimorphilus gyrociliatus TaxID=2664684 RepID=A0A7I8W0W1_9ANNE|nr:DgyrCDS10619 [Dimorphilus gyrociliatus]
MDSDEVEQFDYLFKIVLIGDAGVGKTCIVQRFKSGLFMEQYGSTIGVDFTMKTIVIDDKKIKLQIWDTAGQERFKTITQSYYRSAHAVLLVYDITKEKSFENIEKWLEDVRKYTGNNVLKVLIGNKCDLEQARRISTEKAKLFSEKYNMFSMIEVSAKDCCNINESFINLTKELVSLHSDSKFISNDINLVLGERERQTEERGRYGTREYR